MFTTPGAWFLTSSLHNAWLTELFALLMVLAILAAIGSVVAWRGRKPLVSMDLLAIAFVALLGGLVLWISRLGGYPDEGYLAQLYYIGSVVELILHQAIGAAGVAAMVWPLVHIYVSRRAGSRRHRPWVIAAVIGAGLMLVAAGAFLNF